MSMVCDILRTVNFIRQHPLNKRTKGGLGRYIRYQLASHILSQGGFVVPFVEGTRLLIRRGMVGATGNYYCGLHEFEEMGFLLHLLRDSDVFADVGANVGSYTLLASGVCGARTYSFEPCLSTFSRLRDHIGLNDLSAKVRAVNAAVGAVRGTVSFTQTNDSTNHVVGEQSNETGATVQMVTLDEVMESDCPCLLKIDVEGFETEVIRGAEKTLSSPACKAVIMEVGEGGRYGFDEQALNQKMVGLGFEPCVYDPFSRKLTVDVRDNLSNVLFVKDKAWAEGRVIGAPRRTINGYAL